MQDTVKPRTRIAVTIGDPSGVGPEIVAKLLQPDFLQALDIHVLADREEIDQAARECGVTASLADAPGGGAAIAHGTTYEGDPAERGTPSKEGGARALADLEAALRMYKQGAVDGIVYAPLNKSALRLAGMTEEDELRWFARSLSFSGQTSEINCGSLLMTSRVTSHVPMSRVTSLVSPESVCGAIELLHSACLKAGSSSPRLLVCALNPHAGEGGMFGRTEIDAITPGISLAQEKGVDASGPVPSDTAFIKARNDKYDGVVTMYHDQGQIAMKLLGFENGVTLQGGLPVTITTPAHGTAYDIVGQGRAKVGPMVKALEIAATLSAPGA